MGAFIIKREKNSKLDGGGSSCATTARVTREPQLMAQHARPVPPSALGPVCLL